MCRVRVWGSSAHAYDIIMHMRRASFIDAIVSNIMLGQVFSIS